MLFLPIIIFKLVYIFWISDDCISGIIWLKALKVVLLVILIIFWELVCLSYIDTGSRFKYTMFSG